MASVPVYLWDGCWVGCIALLPVRRPGCHCLLLTMSCTERVALDLPQEAQYRGRHKEYSVREGQKTEIEGHTALQDVSGAHGGIDRTSTVCTYYRHHYELAIGPGVRSHSQH